MKHLFRAAVLLVASLIAIEPLLAAEPCAPGACPGEGCSAGCCGEMPAQMQMAAMGCHTSHAAGPIRSTQSRHRCEMTVSRSTAQLVAPTKLRVSSAAPMNLPAPPAGVLSNAQVTTSSTLPPPVSHSGRYLLLCTFRL